MSPLVNQRQKSPTDPGMVHLEEKQKPDREEKGRMTKETNMVYQRF